MTSKSIRSFPVQSDAVPIQRQDFAGYRSNATALCTSIGIFKRRAKYE